MKLGKWLQPFLGLATIGALCILTGCNDSGGGGSDTDPQDSGDTAGDSNAPMHCLVIGDGISKGVGLEDGAAWPGLLQQQLRAKVSVGAKGGAHTDYGATEIQAFIDYNEPSHVLIFIGSNDVNIETPLEIMRGNYQIMLDTARASDVVPIIATLPPAYGFDNQAIVHGIQVNQMIRNLAKNNDAAVADLEKEFGTDRSLLLEDGLHPSQAGHLIIMAAFLDLLQ